VPMRWNWLPNAICVVRLLLVAPVVAMLLDERYLAALALILFAGFSDALDGFLARAFDWRTRLGSLLDPAADKLLIFSVFVTLSYQGLVPVFVTVVVVMRDVVIVAGAALYQWLIAPLAGDPTIIEPAGKRAPGGTKEPAATTQPSPTSTPSRTTAPMPISTRSPMVQPWTMAPCPRVTWSPSEV